MIKEEVSCPYCGRIQSSRQCPVSYWGTEEDYEKVDCEDCGKTFDVRETVTRTYETFKKGGGAEEER